MPWGDDHGHPGCHGCQICWADAIDWDTVEGPTLDDTELERVARLAHVLCERHRNKTLGAAPRAWKALPEAERVAFRATIRRVLVEGAQAADITPALAGLPPPLRAACEYTVEAIRAAAQQPHKRALL